VQKSDGKIEAVVADGDSVRLVPVTQSETMAKPIPPGGHREATPAVQGPTSQGFKAPVTVASSALGDPTIHSGGPVDGAIFRQVAYQDSTPAADGATHSRAMLSAEGGPSASGKRERYPVAALRPAYLHRLPGLALSTISTLPHGGKVALQSLYPNCTAIASA